MQMKCTLTAVLGGSLLLAFQSGIAHAAPAPDPNVARTTVSAAAQSKASTYWTSSRMKNAVSGDALTAGRDHSKADGKVTVGKAMTKPGTPGAAKKPGPSDPLANGGSLYTGGGQVVQTTGKVFFTLGSTNYVCSGSSTAAANESLVQTAGHCVNEGPGAFATNFVFVPAYKDGAAPYGRFAARALLTTSQWSGSGDFNYDVGYAVVNPIGGTTLSDTVGAQGIGFNLARGARMYSFGYPAAAPYDGSKIATCNGIVVADTVGGSSDQGMVCNLTGGSSGGPWFINYTASTGIGTLNSLNSFKYTSGRYNDKMYGPYFGSVVQNLYTSAQSQ
jgi:V8-like Glu-specific endopeptidase